MQASKTAGGPAQQATAPKIRSDSSEHCRYIRRFAEAESRLPEHVHIRSLKSVVFADIHAEVTVAETRCRLLYIGVEQEVTFNTHLLGQLSSTAQKGVMAHELAHVWLNEHAGPEESKSREREADELARSWGYGAELDALDAEADTVY